LSLILDALRRADSERERGAVPGLHTQQVAVAPQSPRPAGVPPWLWVVIVAALGLLLALAAWFVARGGMSPQVTAPAVAQSPAPPPPAPAAPAIGTPPAQVAVAAPAPPGASAAEAQPVAEPAPWPAADGSRRAPSSDAAAVPAAPLRAGEAKAAPLEAPVTPREQLPENVRAQLPPLAVGGSIYSSNPPDRSVIIDGRILRENDRLAADLTLEQIRPKSAVLRFRGYRFEIAF
jgi:general secretion pathway protein B